MDASGYCITFLLLLAGVLPTAGYGAISVTPADFFKARVCFALSALCALFAALVWGLTSDQAVASKIMVVAVVLASCLVGLVEGLRWLDGRSAKSLSKVSELSPSNTTETILRLQFMGGERAPTELRRENILKWWVVWTGQNTIAEMDKDNLPLRLLQFPKTWVMFLIFDRPITYRQIIVEPSVANFPNWEIKFASNNYMIITTFGTDPPSCILDIYARF